MKALKLFLIMICFACMGTAASAAPATVKQLPVANESVSSVNTVNLSTQSFFGCVTIKIVSGNTSVTIRVCWAAQ